MKKAGMRSLARLAAVQALYQQEHQHLSIDDTLEEFLSYRFGTPVLDDEEAHGGDKVFLVELIKGVATEAKRIDALISASLTREWTLDRLDPVLRAILRAGICELLIFEETPVRVILNEYIELTKAFFEGKEPFFVNGLLHKVAITLQQDLPKEKGAL
ncbi:MAG: transcription antitermination factor NusB [Holosporales bacterium]|nr:transcription antitermination factor NusB [Holosporales bacterium]